MPSDMRIRPGTWLIRSVILVVIVLLTLGPTSDLDAFHGGSDREIGEGDVVPAATRRLRTGEQVTIPSGEGITVVLFWATWSPRSRLALDLWGDFRERYAEHPLTIITLNAEHDELSQQDLKTIGTYIRENEVDLPVVLDEGLELFNTYGVMALPTVFFVDSEGTLLHRYASFPTSAPLDLEEELEIRLGIRERETEEQRVARGKLDYQPKNNALLYYNMGVQLNKKGFFLKARERYVMALKRDPDYLDPVMALEESFFTEARTPESEEALGLFLKEHGLDSLAEKYMPNE